MIDYQCQSSSGGGMDLTIVATPGASVTLTKGSYNKTLVADDNGLVTFKKLANGTYLAVSKLGDLTPVEKEIVILNQKQEYMPQGKMLRDMELGTKIMFGGMKFVLRGLNHEGYPSKSATLMLSHTDDAPIQFDSEGKFVWRDSSLRTNLNGDWINRLLTREKNILLTTEVVSLGLNGTEKITTQDKVFVANKTEYIQAQGNEGTQLYFKDNTDRILKSVIGNGSLNSWTRSIVNSQAMAYMGTNGQISTIEPTNLSIHVAPVLNIPNTTVVDTEPMEDGYYRITQPKMYALNLPIGAKIKFSSGKKYVLMGKNLKDHKPCSVTFVSETIIENSSFGPNTRYDTSTLHTSLMPKYYNELTQAEQKAILEHEFITIPIEGNMTNYKLKSHFYIPSQNEVNLSGNVIEGVNLGFTDNVSRVKTLNGSANWWWLRTAYKASSDSNVRVVGTSGLLSSDYPGRSGGVVPACDLSGEAVIELDTDGYYVVKGI